MKHNAFDIEKLRDYYAKTSNISKFKATYNKSIPSIDDYNTPELWDLLNNRQHINAKSSPMTAHKLEIIANIIVRIGQNKVLNVGCGNGDLEYKLFTSNENKQLSWHGVDISTSSIRKCRKEFPYCKFSVANITNLKFSDGQFDIVVLMEIMEHIRPSDTFIALREISRVMKNDALLILSIPLNEGLYEMVSRNYNPNAHVRVYTPETIIMELNISGFSIIDIIPLIAFSNNYRLKKLYCDMFGNIRTFNNLIVISRRV